MPTASKQRALEDVLLQNDAAEDLDPMMFDDRLFRLVVVNVCFTLHLHASRMSLGSERALTLNNNDIVCLAVGC